MGEYAEMTLDGTCCSSCGEYLGSDAGYPIQCAACAGDNEPAPRRQTIRARPTRSYEAGRDHNGGLIAPPGLGLSRMAIKRRKKRERAEREAQNARA